MRLPPQHIDFLNGKLKKRPVRRAPFQKKEVKKEGAKADDSKDSKSDSKDEKKKSAKKASAATATGAGGDDDAEEDLKPIRMPDDASKAEAALRRLKTRLDNHTTKMAVKQESKT